MRSFQVTSSDKPIAEISFSAKIIGENGKILGARLFEISVPASTSDEASAVKALNDVFSKAVTELVVWTFQSMQKAPDVPASTDP